MPSFALQPGRSAFRSLAARVSFFVFAATLTSALAVAWTSAHALRSFLRAKVEQKIPVSAAHARERLDLWYSHRMLDVQVFARSEIVVDGVARLTRGAAADRQKAATEVEQYLTYVLEGLPDYASIFVLDAKGRRLLGVGRTPTLEPEALAALASVEDVALSGVLADREGGVVQAVTSVVRGRDGAPLATLHATLPIRALAGPLSEDDGSALLRLLLFDAAGRFVASSRPLPVGDRVMSPVLRQAEPGETHEYVAADGRHVVGSATRVPRLDWTLVVEEDYDAAFAPIASILGHTAAMNLGIVLVLSGLAFVGGRSLVRPLHALSDCARRLRDGESQVELPVVDSGDEVGILARSFSEMVASLRRANQTLEQLAITDGLTKIHNHRYFQDQLDKAARRCDRTGAPLALVLVDIDDFKALNDRHGHAVGDEVLERLAALLVEETRDTDIVARYGGEEFAILAPDTDGSGAVTLAEKIRMATGDRPFEVSVGGAVGITVSVGVAGYRGDRRALFEAADRALYAAKRAGKDCVVAAEEEPA